MTTKKLVFLLVSIALMLTLLAAAVFGQVADKNNVYRYLSIFTEVFSLVRSNYVENVPPDALVDGAFSGVTDAVDEFSYYVPPAQMPQYRQFADLEDNGIGLVVSKRFGYGYVITPVPGSPADAAGIEASDFIEEIAGLPTQKMSVWQIRSALQIKEGESVKVGILRGGLAKRSIKTVVRKAYSTDPLKTRELGAVSYVKVPTFEKGTAEELGLALNKVRTAGGRKVIIDVRGNASGSIDEAINAADVILSGGTITSLVGKRVEAKKWDADKATHYDGEIQVLTDQSTAGPAEIFAAAIHGNKRGKLVGVPTYGRSIVQRLIQLPSGGALYVTIGHYTTPELKPIKAQGVRPDVLVDLSLGAVEEDEDKPKAQEEDLILNKALTIFGEKPLKVAA